LHAAAFWLVFISGSDGEPLPSSHFVRNENSGRVIVFVHGFRGNSIETWSNGSSYWPDMITKDRDYDGVDVFAYEYPTSFTNNLTLEEIAEDMHTALKVNGVTDRR
jgi:hypothetical protein